MGLADRAKDLRAATCHRALHQTIEDVPRIECAGALFLCPKAVYQMRNQSAVLEAERT